MKSKKGFTLTELLAVVLILVLFSVMAFTLVTKITERSRMRAFIKEANVFAKGAINKYYNDKMLDESLRDDLYNGTVNGKVCYSITDNILGKYVVKDKKVKYSGSVEVCYADDCTYQTRLWFTNGKGFYINGESIIKDEDDIDFTSIEENFNSCGFDTIGSYKGTPTVALFEYTGDEQRLTILKDGYYRLEGWGAQGGNYAIHLGGYGAYAHGEVYLKKGDVLYINVGGQGVTDCKGGCKGGYNGGGSSPSSWSSGGGATSFALNSGTVDKLGGPKLLLVASGGGGASSTGGHDYRHGLGICVSEWSCGQYSLGSAKDNSAGGGGYKGIGTSWVGAGGIAYTANDNVKDSYTYCYKCYESYNNSSRTISTSNISVTPKAKVAKIGDGYAKVTYLASYQLAYNLNGGIMTGNSQNPSSYSTESDAITLINPTKANYDSTGWDDGTNNLFNMFSTPSKSSYYIKSDGTEVSHDEYSIFQVSIDPNTNYTIVNSGQSETPGFAVFDSEGNYLTGDNYNNRSQVSFKTPSNASYIRFSVVTKQSSTRYDRRLFKLIKPTLTTVIPKGSTGSKNFTAYYIPIDYTVTYDLNGGTLSSQNRSTYNVETNTFTLNNPTKDGYYFTGWTGSNGTTPQTNVSIAKGSSGNKSYTANYEKFTKHTFDYNLPEYTFETVASAIMESRIYNNYDYDLTIDMIYNLPTSGKRYLLIGNYNAGGSLNLEITADNKIRVHENGDRAFSQAITIGEDIHGVLNYTASGKTFTYEYTSESSSGSINGTFRPSGFASASLRLSQDYRGGTTFTGYTIKSLKITHYVIPSKFPSDVTLPGYTFDGWYTSPVGGTQVTVGNYASHENETLYAHWTANV
ncbi:MAG: InlB B-repeat-containing protein [Bacilli bacterium]|nr:InlB B-repeat-containing protein [Bacilli bacterium]